MDLNPIREVLRKHMARPTVEAVRHVAFTPELRAVDETNRTITFVASTEDVDRYGDVIRVAGWDTANYMKNPVFLWAHGHTDPPIGRCVGIRQERSPKPALVQDIQFADKKTYPFADTIYQLYKQKFLTSVSVGFRPLERPTPITDENGDSTGGYEFTSQELLELSAVPIPANPDAIARAVANGIVTRSLADEVFLLDEQEPSGEAVMLARELLVSTAARAGLPVVRCSDRQAVQRAQIISSLAGISRTLGHMADCLPHLPPAVVAEFDQWLKEMNASLAEDDAQQFFEELTAAGPNLDDFLAALEE